MKLLIEKIESIEKLMEASKVPSYTDVTENPAVEQWLDKIGKIPYISVSPSLKSRDFVASYNRFKKELDKLQNKIDKPSDKALDIANSLYITFVKLKKKNEKNYADVKSFQNLDRESQTIAYFDGVNTALALNSYMNWCATNSIKPKQIGKTIDPKAIDTQQKFEKLAPAEVLGFPKTWKIKGAKKKYIPIGTVTPGPKKSDIYKDPAMGPLFGNIKDLSPQFKDRKAKQLFPANAEQLKLIDNLKKLEKDLDDDVKKHNSLALLYVKSDPSTAEYTKLRGKMVVSYYKLIDMQGQYLNAYRKYSSKSSDYLMKQMKVDKPIGDDDSKLLDYRYDFKKRLLEPIEFVPDTYKRTLNIDKSIDLNPPKKTTTTFSPNLPKNEASLSLKEVLSDIKEYSYTDFIKKSKGAKGGSDVRATPFYNQFEAEDKKHVLETGIAKLLDKLVKAGEELSKSDDEKKKRKSAVEIANMEDTLNRARKVYVSHINKYEDLGLEAIESLLEPSKQKKEVWLEPVSDADIKKYKLGRTR